MRCHWKDYVQEGTVCGQPRWNWQGVVDENINLTLDFIRDRCTHVLLGVNIPLADTRTIDVPVLLQWSFMGSYETHQNAHHGGCVVARSVYVTLHVSYLVKSGKLFQVKINWKRKTCHVRKLLELNKQKALWNGPTVEEKCFVIGIKYKKHYVDVYFRLSLLQSLSQRVNKFSQVQSSCTAAYRSCLKDFVWLNSQ